MANVTPGNVSMDSTGLYEYIYGNLVFSGTYPAGGGEPFDVSQFWFDKSIPKKPVGMSIFGAAGYTYGYVPGTTYANGKIKICTASATELTNIGYPGGITGDTVYFAIVLKKA